METAAREMAPDGGLLSSYPVTDKSLLLVSLLYSIVSCM